MRVPSRPDLHLRQNHVADSINERQKVQRVNCASPNYKYALAFFNASLYLKKFFHIKTEHSEERAAQELSLSDLFLTHPVFNLQGVSTWGGQAIPHYQSEAFLYSNIIMGRVISLSSLFQLQPLVPLILFFNSPPLLKE